MLNWIKFIVVFLLILTTVISVMVLFNANKPVAAAKRAAIDSALASGQLVSANSAEIFNSTASLVTVYGEGEGGEEKAVFVDGKSEDGFQEVLMADGISAEQAVENVKQELNVSTIHHVALGMEDEGPVWEVTFKGDNGKLNYVYVFFEDGQWWKRILNL